MYDGSVPFLTVCSVFFAKYVEVNFIYKIDLLYKNLNKNIVLMLVFVVLKNTLMLIFNTNHDFYIALKDIGIGFCFSAISINIFKRFSQKAYKLID